MACSFCNPTDDKEYNKVYQSAKTYAQTKKVSTVIYKSYGQWFWCTETQADERGISNPQYISAYS